MPVSAQIAIYQLGQEQLGPAVHAVSDALTARGLAPSVGPMSTLVTGELDTVLDGLRAAFRATAEAGPVVMTVTLSNACPVAS
ncbi:MAG TPA: YkoF family thiamine/hydroxymethylpyrimidine-binding protein [Methylomirabilota bacterium]|nr:YkoF family thiamine/hydroxymethylpyrimidine-binding protein [Methylomirabilota bacterium]